MPDGTPQTPAEIAVARDELAETVALMRAYGVTGPALASAAGALSALGGRAAPKPYSPQGRAYLAAHGALRAMHGRNVAWRAVRFHRHGEAVMPKRERGRSAASKRRSGRREGELDKMLGDPVSLLRIMRDETAPTALRLAAARAAAPYFHTPLPPVVEVERIGSLDIAGHGAASAEGTKDP